MLLMARLSYACFARLHHIMLRFVVLDSAPLIFASLYYACFAVLHSTRLV